MSLLLNKLKNVVTEEEFKEISDDYSHTIISEGQRNGKLLILLQKGESAFDLFVSALKEEDKHLGHESLLAKIATRRREGKSFQVSHYTASWTEKSMFYHYD